MRFLCVFKSSQNEGVPPTEKEMAEMGRLIDDMAKSGSLLMTEGCLPSALGARVRRSSERFTVTDGPFTEAKELIGGFAIFETTSKDEAIELTKRFLRVAGDGETEIRQFGNEKPAFASETCAGTTATASGSR